MRPLTLPPELVAFILKNLHSIEQVEILVLLLRNLNNGLTIEQLDLEIKTNIESVMKRLRDLQARNLVQEANEDPRTYRINQNPENLRSCNDLAKYYLTHRTSIIDLLYSRPSEAIGSFASAFRLGSRGKKA